MEGELLLLATAPTTKATIQSLSERLTSENPAALAEEAMAHGELRAAVNIALAGALRGSPPSARLAARLVPALENTDLALSLLGTVRNGLAGALVESASSTLHTASRQGLILFLAAANLEGRAPSAELLRRIRLTARAALDGQARILVGLAALEVGDPDALEVAGSCVVAADNPAGRRAARDLLQKLKRPLREALPEEAPPEMFGGFTVRRTAPRTGRNDPCRCGSGKKYKRCCLTSATAVGPEADVGRAWGDRARHHRSMTDEQFAGLHPLELARIRPHELETSRLLRATARLAEHRLFDDAVRLHGELVARRDVPEGTTSDSVRVDILTKALAARDLHRAEEIFAAFESEHAVPDHVRLAMEILRESPQALERIESLADRALRESSKEVLGALVGTLLYFVPALGILLARGTMDPARPIDVESDLRLVEEARDKLLLPPNDPAWEVFDLLSERHVEAQLAAEAVTENEELLAEAEELRRAVAGARAREQSVRRALQERERELARAFDATRAERETADRRRELAGPSPAEMETRRKKIQELKTRIAEGNRERRELRDRLSEVSSRLEAAESVDAPPEEPAEAVGLEYGEAACPERAVPRIPVFTREFREGVRAVADHVARDALATAGALAATDPGAWSSVKKVKQLEETLSCRIGSHRILFRLSGEGEIELRRLIHRRDLESVLKRME